MFNIFKWFQREPKIEIPPVPLTEREFVLHAHKHRHSWDFLKPGDIFALTDSDKKNYFVDETEIKIVPLAELSTVLADHNHKWFCPVKMPPCKCCGHVKSIRYIPCAGFTLHEMNPDVIPEGFVMIRLGRISGEDIATGA